MVDGLHRVVITGLGAVTPIGNTVQDYWNGLTSGSNGGDAFSCFVGNLDIKGLFKGHHEFHGVQRISTQIVLEVGFGLHFAGVNTQLLRND